MVKYLRAFLILIIQVVMFYLFPLIAKPVGAIAMVLFIIFATFILAVLMGIVLNKKIKFLYPVIVGILFIPSVFIYYNETALIQAIWYLVVSYIGLFSGVLIKGLS